MTKNIYGLVGHPVKHSLSPAMQNAAFKASGIEAEYFLYDVEPENLNDFLKNAVVKGVSGLNVTVPHKIMARDYLETNGSLDDAAERIGAVNTIKVTDGKLCGFNTDGPGFYRSLLEDLRFEPEGKTVFVLGSGGAARAVVMYLGACPRKIFISDVDNKKSEELVSHYGKYFNPSKIEIVKRSEMLRAIESSQLLVQATPVGMNDGDPLAVDEAFLHPGLYVYDLVYNLPMTKLIRAAKSRKCHTANGLGMLLYQGAVAFEIWTGLKAPISVMKRALTEGLKSR